MGIEALEAFKSYLDQHTAEATDPHLFGGPAASRYESFRYCFDHVLARGGRNVVELGTVRSFVHGGVPGCNSDDRSYWQPDRPELWDWGAGCFSLLAAECLADSGVTIHTVDVATSHLDRCRIVTSSHADSFVYHLADSVQFLRGLPPHSVDLLYLDTGDMWPIEPVALHQLAEAKAAVGGDVLVPGGLVLIDDVRNATPLRHEEQSRRGKAKYSLPYLTSHGYTVVFDGYQVALERHSRSARRSRFRPWGGRLR